MIESSPRATATVSIVDDDADVREALRGLFRSVGLDVQAFGSTTAFLAKYDPEQLGCLVLDVRLPGQSGLEFFDEMGRLELRCPVVFLSGHADIAMSVRAMKAGAVEFLTKPVRDQDLLDAVHLAIERDRSRKAEEESARSVREQFANLTPRERAVLAELVAGHRNKEIAGKLAISEATVKLHRTHIMQKLRAQTLVELVRLFDLYTGSEGPSTKG